MARLKSTISLALQSGEALTRTPLLSHPHSSSFGGSSPYLPQLVCGLRLSTKQHRHHSVGSRILPRLARKADDPTMQGQACFGSASPSGPGPTSADDVTAPTTAEASSPDVRNGAAAADGEVKASASGGPQVALPGGELEFVALQGWRKLVAQLKMAVAFPWARVKKGSVLSLTLSGRVSEQLIGFGSAVVTLPRLLDNLQKAAVDPRVSALLARIDPLALGWGKVDEIRRHVEYFRKSGKPSIAFLPVVGEVEYYLASAFEEIYVPPSAYVSLRGLAVQGTYLGGVLEKVGVQPQVQRIGKYKSAGDSLARRDMSEANREMLTALLDDIYINWVSTIASAHGSRSVEEMEGLLDAGVIRAEQLLDAGLVTGLKYEGEVEDALKERLGQKNKERPLVKVNFRRYSRVSKWTLNMGGGRDALIAVLRAAGSISQGRDRGMGGGSVRADSFIEKIRFVRESKQFKALVLRVDSPGGDALASDLMWHELRELAKVKPVVASMSDVAASGGYYMAMAAPVIVAERLTLTGSIGVVLAKFNLGDLYSRIGFTRELLSRGKYAELNADYRPFRPDEEEFFAEGAQSAYQSFRDKAAMSRGLEVDAMEAVAQGRVWTGQQAHERGLVDALGGFSRAVAIAKERAGIPASKQARLVELSYMGPSLSLLLAGARVLLQALGLEGRAEQRAALASLLLDSAGSVSGTGTLLEAAPGSPQAVMPDLQVVGLSQPGLAATQTELNQALPLLLRSFIQEPLERQ